MTPARLIPWQEFDGPLNMAIDSVLLARAEQSDSVVLRLYGWSEPTLSLGYFQPYADRQQHPASESIAVVRRETGGGAIIHDRELTYSLIVPRSQLKRLPPATLYCQVHRTLAAVLNEQYGVPAETCGTPTVDGPAAPFLCFQRRADGDLIVDTIKIGGSAQRRPRGAVLQHGSLLVERSPFAPELDGIRERLPPGQSFDLEGFLPIWLPRLGERLGCEWQSQPLSEEELTEAGQLAAEKFGHADWTRRR